MLFIRADHTVPCASSAKEQTIRTNNRKEERKERKGQGKGDFSVEKKKNSSHNLCRYSQCLDSIWASLHFLN